MCLPLFREYFPPTGVVPIYNAVTANEEETMREAKLSTKFDVNQKSYRGK